MFRILLLLMVFNSGILLSQDIKRIGVNELTEILKNSNDELFVVNFWATWCGPCVTELPYFQEASEIYPDEKIEFLLISLDFPSQVESRLIPFLEEKEIDLPVILMEELDYDKWISRVDPEWKGNLPATLVFNNARGKRSFLHGAIEKHELLNLIEKNLN